MRPSFELSAKNAKIEDCLAERGGFENPTEGKPGKKK
jgi:hypothetical protein